jgi:hypothetical protein
VRAPRRVEFTVVGKADGRPVARAMVFVCAGANVLGTAGLDVRGGSWPDAIEPVALDATSDAAGRVEIDGIPACEDCSVAVAVPGLGPMEPRFSPAALSFSTSGDAPIHVRVELEPACTVEGSCAATMGRRSSARSSRSRRSDTAPRECVRDPARST